MNCLKGDRMDNRPVKTDPEIGEKRQKVKKLRRDAFIKIIGSAAVLVVTFGCVFGITRAPANDMYPAVHKGDLIIYYRQGKIINSDVVVYEAPDGSRQIGRIEGTQGEREYLILGDCRETAKDSRSFGLIPRRAIKGKVFTIVRRRPL